jgi:PAS domain S-box-containing protein
MEDGGSPARTARGAEGADTARLAAAYRADTARLLQARIPYAVAVFAVAMGAGSIFEAAYYPDRTARILWADAAYFVVCASGLLASRAGGPRVPQAWIAAALASALTLGMCAYHASVGAVAERLAMAELCVLTMFLFLLPLGMRAQSLVGAAALVGFALAGPSLRPSETLAFVGVVLSTGAATSVMGAAFLDHYRRDAFVRAALLGETSAFNAAILEAALDAVVTMNDEGRIVEFNRAAERMFGRPRAAVLGRDMAEMLMPARLQGDHRRGLARHLATGESRLLGQRREVVGQRADGSEFALELAITRIEREGPPTFTGHLRDITERKRAEEVLTASKRRSEEEAEIAAALVRVGETLSAHLDQPDLLGRVSRLACDTLRTDACATLLWDDRRHAFRLAGHAGLPAEFAAELAHIDFTLESLPAVRAIRAGQFLEIEDVTRQTLVPPHLLQRWSTSSAFCAPVARRGEIIAVMAYTYRTRTGPFAPRQRRLAQGIAHATAIALENARLIADLQDASRLKTEFVSTMSHELRTPLHVILGFCEMARDPALAGSEREASLAKIEAAGQELLGLIESTLEIGRFESGRDVVRLETVSLPGLWAELAQGCAALPRSPEVELQWGEPPDLALRTDPRKLTIVMRNLVGNALKFTERGRVRAEAALTATALVITIADTGIGIRREDHEAIFEVFRQADGSDTRRYGGVGLGLYIVRRFVQQLGGTITLASEPEHGSTFVVALPREGEAPPVPRAA